MSVGGMRFKVELQKRTDTDDGFGGCTTTWSTVESVWADIAPINNFEKYKGMQIQSGVTHDISIRYRSDVGLDWRLKFSDKIFGIKKVINPDLRKRYLQILAEESLTG